jgi:uncharacterized protein
MTRLLAVLIVYALTSTFAVAADSPPSQESLQRLLTVTDAKRMLQEALSTVDQSMEMGIKQALKGQTLNAQEQKAIDEMRTRMSALFRESLAWDTLEPMFLDIYSRSLTQGEVDGMLAFYATDAGRAVIAKMPLIMQNTMQAMQGRMQTLAPKIAQIQQDTFAKLKEGGAK